MSLFCSYPTDNRVLNVYLKDYDVHHMSSLSCDDLHEVQQY